MNKNAIKKFAIDARNKLIASVTDKAGMLGITASGVSDAITKGRDFEVYKTSAGTEVTLNRIQSEQRRRLVAQIEARGFEAVIEEVAYTWFNRICAIRFMEVNDYIPVRVLSSIKEGKTEPDLVTNAPEVDIEFTDAEKSFILEAKIGNKLDELFRMLFIKQCHELNDILPELFEKTEDYTEMLLNISYTNEDDVVRMLVDGVEEKDFNVTALGEDGKPTGQVEIIGWLYQYYNTELKDDTFAKLKKNVKITKERIPAATQLFTPDWIVRYMVENSVGRIWIEHLRALDSTTDEKATAENFGWKYYLPEAEQEESVNIKLAEIRTSYADLKPEDITCIDPCMGSGHILIAMFDVLMDIYKSTGYSEKEAAFSIVEKNIHGLDIDKRAYQLAYFAVMMKGRGYNRRFFRGHDDQKPQPKVYAIQESNGINRAHIKYFGVGLSAIEKNNAMNQIEGLLQVMTDAREYGSILNVDNYDWDLLRRFAAESGEDNQLNLETIGIEKTKNEIVNLIVIGEILSNKFSCVITNPPYMGGRNMNEKLLNKIVQDYPAGKADIFSAFILRCRRWIKNKGLYAMITQHSWMFLSSFETLRTEVLNGEFINMCHLGPRAFEEISGEVVQTVAWVGRREATKGYKAEYVRLVEEDSQKSKEEAFLTRNASIYSISKKVFEDVPGNALAYWIANPEVFNEGKLLEMVANPRQGLKTLDNDYYIKLWFEVDYENICFDASNADEGVASGRKWFPLNHGGEFRKYYGNNVCVVNWFNDGEEMKANAVRKYNSVTRTITNMNYYFKPGVTWSVICSAPSFRWYDKGFIFSNGGQCVVPDDHTSLVYITGLLNSKVTEYLLNILSPTLGFESGYMKKIPVIYDLSTKEIIEQLTSENIKLSKEDWDDFEISWDFKKHPLVFGNNIKDSFEIWSRKCEERFQTVKRNEERINQYLISTYGLERDLPYQVEDKYISVRKADRERDVKSLLSYAVGCMFGRYSLDREGICCAGEQFENNWFVRYKPDVDNIIPITDEEYFDDDIVSLLCKWLVIAFGADTLEDNLEYIAGSLKNKGNSSRAIIRNYFLKDFWTDHCSTYSVQSAGKKPIYWLFDSGKEDGFKCLCYMHRYNPDLIGRIRTEYLHKTQNAIAMARSSAERIAESTSSGGDKALATRRISKYTKQIGELQIYDEAIAHVANQRIEITIDAGVKKNISLFQGIEISKEGKKPIVIDLVAKI